jgi:hypothetical protein
VSARRALLRSIIVRYDFLPGNTSVFAAYTSHGEGISQIVTEAHEARTDVLRLIDRRIGLERLREDLDRARQIVGTPQAGHLDSSSRAAVRPAASCSPA